MKKTVFKCAVCGSSNKRLLLQINRPDRFELSVGVSSQDYVRQWVECEQCGTASNLLPSKSVERLAMLRASYYEVDFMDSDIAEKYKRVMSMPKEQSDNAGRVSRILNFLYRYEILPTCPRVMDIGAGTGVFLSRLIDEISSEWECFAIEPDPKAAFHLQQLNKFKVVEAMFTGQAMLNNFNLVTLNKVLEHIEQPLDFLKQVSSSLAHNNGILYIEVPDKVTTYLRAPEDNILGALHSHLYDPVSIGYLIRQAGLEPLRIERITEPSGKLTVYAFAIQATALTKRDLPRE